jgi:hypothetical protein
MKVPELPCYYVDSENIKKIEMKKRLEKCENSPKKFENLSILANFMGCG